MSSCCAGDGLDEGFEAALLVTVSASGVDGEGGAADESACGGAADDTGFSEIGLGFPIDV